MAKLHKVKPAKNSSKSSAKLNKRPSKRKLADPPPDEEPPVGECCCCCDGHAAGSLLFCEDGAVVPLLPPTVPSYLRFDPAGSGFPYWEPE